MRLSSILWAFGLVAVVFVCGCGDEPTPEPEIAVGEEAAVPAGFIQVPIEEYENKISAFDDGTFELRAAGDDTIRAYIYKSATDDMELVVAADSGSYKTPFDVANWGGGIEHSLSSQSEPDVIGCSNNGDNNDYVEICDSLGRRLGGAYECIYGMSAVRNWDWTGCPKDDVDPVVYGSGVYEVTRAGGGSTETVGFLLSNTSTGTETKGQEICVTKAGTLCEFGLTGDQVLTFSEARDWPANASTFECSLTDDGRKFVFEAKTRLACGITNSTCHRNWVTIKTSPTCSAVSIRP